MSLGRCAFPWLGFLGSLKLEDALSLNAMFFEILKKFFFFFGNVDIGIFEGIHFNINESSVSKVLF